MHEQVEYGIVTLPFFSPIEWPALTGKMLKACAERRVSSGASDDHCLQSG